MTLRFTPRSYQIDLAAQVKSEPRNALVQADTGAGKTDIIADVAMQNEFVLVVAHRNLLIRQASVRLARRGIRHNFICSEHTRRQAILEHRRALGSEFVDTSATKYVTSVDRLLSLHRRGILDLDVTLPWKILVDEAHHMLEKNKWGKLAAIFPSAQIIGFTATPCRADGRSLSSRSDGVFDVLLQAEELKQNSVRKLISRGYLSDFKIWTLPESKDFEGLIVGPSGEYTDVSQLAVFSDREYVFAGSALKHYKRLANGKQAVVFCVGIRIAEATAQAFRDAGYSAACINSKMSAIDVARIFDAFRNREIQIICHVDMLGEGIDVPAIECLILLRKTASLVNYRQWIGRSLRPEDGKDHAIIIDHCGNVLEHGLPDRHIAWNLDVPPRVIKSNLVVCKECHSTFRAWETACPECGEKVEIKRGSGDAVHGVRYIDLELVEAKRMLVEKELRDRTVMTVPQFTPDAVGTACRKLATWLSDVVSVDVDIETMNRFFKTDGKTVDFWIRNFTVADMNRNNVSKAKKVIWKWLKSNS